MEFRDYYDVMGIKRDATQDEVKRAYRKLARKYHPDVSKEKDADVRFKEVGEAYAVLQDPEKRAAYDQLGPNWEAGQNFNPPPNWDAGFEFHGSGSEDPAAYSDFFESLFGQGFRSQQTRGRHGRSRIRGEDHHAKVLIDVEDAYHGATRSISLRTPEIDSNGHVTTKERSLSVKIPKGVKQGQHIRLAGQGSPGLANGEAGDLYLEIEFKAHPVFRVEGLDVYIDLPVTPWELALGANVTVPTPNGHIDLKIPKATTGGRKLRLKSRGIPGKPAGDLFVVPKITLPPADSEAAEALYAKMAQDLPYNPRARMGV